MFTQANFDQLPYMLPLSLSLSLSLFCSLASQTVVHYNYINMTKTIGIEYIIGNFCGYTFVEILKSVAIKLS